MSQISHTYRLKHFEELYLFLWSMNIFMHFFVLLFLDWCHMHAWYWMCSTIPGHFNELISKLIVYYTFFFFKKGTRWRKYWCKTMFTTRMNKSTRTKCFLTMSPHYFWEWRVLEIIRKALWSQFSLFTLKCTRLLFSHLCKYIFFCERKVFFNCSYSLWILQTVRPGFAVYFYISEYMYELYTVYFGKKCWKRVIFECRFAFLGFLRYSVVKNLLIRHLYGTVGEIWIQIV